MVGIGGVDSAKTFCEKVGWPLERMLVDDSDTTEVYQAAGTRNSQRDENGQQIFEGVKSMWGEATNDALESRGKADLDAITGKPWAPGPYVPLMPKVNG